MGGSSGKRLQCQADDRTGGHHHPGPSSVARHRGRIWSTSEDRVESGDRMGPPARTKKPTSCPSQRVLGPHQSDGDRPEVGGGSRGSCAGSSRSTPGAPRPTTMRSGAHRSGRRCGRPIKVDRQASGQRRSRAWFRRRKGERARSGRSRAVTTHAPHDGRSAKQRRSRSAVDRQHESADGSIPGALQRSRQAADKRGLDSSRSEKLVELLPARREAARTRVRSHHQVATNGGRPRTCRSNENTNVTGLIQIVLNRMAAKITRAAEPMRSRRRPDPERLMDAPPGLRRARHPRAASGVCEAGVAPARVYSNFAGRTSCAGDSRRLKNPLRRRGAGDRHSKPRRPADAADLGRTAGRLRRGRTIGPGDDPERRELLL